MTVAQLLSCISSRELTEWQAYEQATGPLGSRYSDDVLAAIHEQLQISNRMYGEQFEENMVPIPKAVLRPDQVFQPRENEDGDVMSFAEFDSQFDQM